VLWCRMTRHREKNDGASFSRLQLAHAQLKSQLEIIKTNYKGIRSVLEYNKFIKECPLPDGYIIGMQIPPAEEMETFDTEKKLTLYIHALHDRFANYLMLCSISVSTLDKAMQGQTTLSPKIKGATRSVIDMLNGDEKYFAERYIHPQIIFDTIESLLDQMQTEGKADRQEVVQAKACIETFCESYQLLKPKALLLSTILSESDRGQGVPSP